MGDLGNMSVHGKYIMVKIPSLQTMKRLCLCLNKTNLIARSWDIGTTWAEISAYTYV